MSTSMMRYTLGTEVVTEKEGEKSVGKANTTPLGSRLGRHLIMSSRLREYLKYLNSCFTSDNRAYGPDAVKTLEGNDLKCKDLGR
jgi:hypothetical protein